MSNANQSHSSAPSVGAGVILAMLGAVVVPATITLNTIRIPATLQLTDPNPTPHGYTWSLALFCVPILVIALWFTKHKRVQFSRRAFWWTIGILVPLGFGLDFWFGNLFFRFPWLGLKPLIGLGTVAIGLFVIWGLRNEPGKLGPVWPVFLALAGFLYLWWLAALILDLVLVWHFLVHYPATVRQSLATMAGEPAEVRATL
jgi:hypothetical protein